MSRSIMKTQSLLPSDQWGYNTPRFRIYTERQFDQIDALKDLPEELRFSMRVVANVLPFRVNQYVISNLIDWTNIPDDPIFQLTFPQPGMLAKRDFDCIADLLKRGVKKNCIREEAHRIHAKLNPHPAAQQQLNIPRLEGEPLPGMQHKYRETVLFFPSQGQTCHSYCTFCFRWAQFVGDKALRFAVNESHGLHQYLLQHNGVSDLLFTGGDPMVMKTHHLAEYLKPLLSPKFNHVQTIRIGTKSLSFWPHRYVSDADADELLYLLESLVDGGKHIALMAHYDHWRELETPIAQEAIRRIRDTGTVIRTQAPLLSHINDSADVWSRMWQTQVKLGMVPYYMFVERDTGARHYFEVPLYRAWEIYRDAMQKLSGLGRTARGPSMSTAPGKIEVQGVTEVSGKKVFVLRFLQGRNPDWILRPFFARYDTKATWFDQLLPAFGEKKFFFEPEFRSMCRTSQEDENFF